VSARRHFLFYNPWLLCGIGALAAGLFTLSSCSSLNSPKPPTPPVVSLPASAAFGSVPQGGTSPVMTVTLKNTGGGPLTFTSNPAVTGANAADFVITSSTCSTASMVAAGATCTVMLTFKPSTMAAESASLTFADNASNSPQSVSLTGTGTSGAAAPVVSLPASVPFGSVAQGIASTPVTVTLMNTGTASLTFTSPPSVSGTNAADFAITANTCLVANPVAPGGNCAVTLTFTPSTQTMESASLNFADNAANSPQIVPLSGTGTAAVNNVLPVQVNAGPIGGQVDILYVTVTICVPGTANCQNIPFVQVDTGSSGLRLLASSFSLPLQTMTNLSGNPFANCVQFADMSYAWGPVQTADIVLSGEKASAVPIQVINLPGFPAVPIGANGCAVTGGTNLVDQSSLGANGIIGLGLFQQDCGSLCAAVAVPAAYYSCVGTTCSPTTMLLANQLQNPVALFSQDNNGVLINLPTPGPAGSATLSGTLIFGIGTQANNQLGTAKVYTTDTAGNFTATFNTINYSGSFVDSGSNGIFFLDTAQTNLAHCTTATGFYCSSTASFTVTNTGTNSVSGQVMFSISNAETLFNANPSFAAFPNIGGPFPGAFDYGLPFFFGRAVFTGIEGQPVAGSTGPLFAF
jgi:hypothetical protein